MRTSTRIRIAMLAGIVACGCASQPNVRVDKDPGVDMSAYKTFGFFDRVATDRSGYTTIVTTHLKRSTRAKLESLGYVYDERAPQLRVNFFLNVVDRQDIRSSPSAGGYYGYRLGRYATWGGYPYDVNTVRYKAGTLSIDLVDARRNALVWQGVAEGKVRDKAIEDPGPAIDTAVSEIFRGFPNPPAT